MTFLLISTCENKLSELEFVLPISRLIPNSNYKILHYADCSKKILNEYEKIIICGTSLKDTSYLNKLDYFKNLFSTYEGPVLGICSGMQIIGSIFGRSAAVGAPVSSSTTLTKASNNSDSSSTVSSSRSERPSSKC